MRAWGNRMTHTLSWRDTWMEWLALRLGDDMRKQNNRHWVLERYPIRMASTQSWGGLEETMTGSESWRDTWLEWQAGKPDHGTKRASRSSALDSRLYLAFPDSHISPTWYIWILSAYCLLKYFNKIFGNTKRLRKVLVFIAYFDQK